jgi:predicted GNAT family N-acyltransferase
VTGGAKIVRAEFDSGLYRQNLKLRAGILRQPLGLELVDEDTANDAHEHHFSVTVGNKAIACVQLRPLNAQTLKLRQMAVAEEFRGKGMGAALVRFAEGWARDAGFRTIMMHARATAVGFYEKLGYISEGEPFEECTIPHIVMRKRLA